MSKIKEYIIDGYKYAVDMDLEKFFKGNLNKGIRLFGEVGTGKIMILKILCEFMLHANKIIAQYSACYVNNIFERRLTKKERLLVSPLFIDDIGTEQPQINVFGTIKQPIYEILNQRYLDKRFLMFVTTNLSPSQIEERYGDRVRNRLKEMFNVMSMQGESRRY
ncbi:hypothetical protein [Ancylomarina longa]|uniref:ATP-binding protein n=1 Tax=Ancylomarina longa TaxID=2487017 RepID=A0A434AUJ0_9BACT|nr:hypothetical protein [Ancylomarina longa]RUT78013.1 hypothetical protein DLK05_10215 [Ancylomarina longa]